MDRDSIYVRDGPVWTSAGASSGFDLTLALVAEDLGSAVAREVARELVLYLRRPGGQAQFSRFLASQADPETPIGKVQSWALGDQILFAKCNADDSQQTAAKYGIV